MAGDGTFEGVSFTDNNPDETSRRLLDDANSNAGDSKPPETGGPNLKFEDPAQTNSPGSNDAQKMADEVARLERNAETFRRNQASGDLASITVREPAPPENRDSGSPAPIPKNPPAEAAPVVEPGGAPPKTDSNQPVVTSDKPDPTGSAFDLFKSDQAAPSRSPVEAPISQQVAPLLSPGEVPVSHQAGSNHGGQMAEVAHRSESHDAPPANAPSDRHMQSGAPPEPSNPHARQGGSDSSPAQAHAPHLTPVPAQDSHRQDTGRAGHTPEYKDSEGINSTARAVSPGDHTAPENTHHTSKHQGQPTSESASPLQSRPGNRAGTSDIPARDGRPAQGSASTPAKGRVTSEASPEKSGSSQANPPGRHQESAARPGPVTGSTLTSGGAPFRPGNRTDPREKAAVDGDLRLVQKPAQGRTASQSPKADAPDTATSTRQRAPGNQIADTATRARTGNLQGDASGRLRDDWQSGSGRGLQSGRGDMSGKVGSLPGAGSRLDWPADKIAGSGADRGAHAPDGKIATGGGGLDNKLGPGRRVALSGEIPLVTPPGLQGFNTGGRGLGFRIPGLGPASDGMPGQPPGARSGRDGLAEAVSGQRDTSGGKGGKRGDTASLPGKVPEGTGRKPLDGTTIMPPGLPAIDLGTLGPRLPEKKPAPADTSTALPDKVPGKPGANTPATDATRAGLRQPGQKPEAALANDRAPALPGAIKGPPAPKTDQGPEKPGKPKDTPVVPPQDAPTRVSREPASKASEFQLPDLSISDSLPESIYQRRLEYIRSAGASTEEPHVRDSASDKEPHDLDEDKGKTYIVQLNDTLESIAAKMLQDELLALLLLEMNKTRIPTCIVDGQSLLDLKPGTVLYLPTAAKVQEFRRRLALGLSSIFKYAAQSANPEEELTEWENQTRQQAPDE